MNQFIGSVSRNIVVANKSWFIVFLIDSKILKILKWIGMITFFIYFISGGGILWGIVGCVGMPIIFLGYFDREFYCLFMWILWLCECIYTVYENVFKSVWICTCSSTCNTFTTSNSRCRFDFLYKNLHNLIVSMFYSLFLLLYPFN